MGTLVMIPWMFKILYGAIADSVRVFGSRKKSWMIIMSIVQGVAFLICAACEIESPYLMCFFLMLT